MLKVKSKITIPFFDYRRQLKKIKPAIDLAFKEVLNSGRLILDSEVKNFEITFAKYIGTKYAIGVNSGTDALKIALKAIGIKPGDEIITVSFTAVPTISAIRELGAIPRFVDIKDDFTMDEARIIKAINKKTKLILPVHLYGQACNMPAILKIANKFKLKVVEDCAQAHVAKIGNKKVGNFGDLSCFSFYPTKNLGAYGDAGLIVTNNKKSADICRQLRIYGMGKNCYSELEGYNSRLDEIQAAILHAKLKFLDQWTRRRQQIAKLYLNNINNPKIILPPITNSTNHSFHLFVIRTKNRTSLIKYLISNSVGYGIHYPYPVHLQSAYKFLSYKKGSLPKTEKFANQILSLPIFPELTNQEVKFIINLLNKF